MADGYILPEGGVLMEDAFCYALLNASWEPFYIGIGTKRSRPYDHVRDAKNGKPGRKCNVIRKMLRLGQEVTVFIVGEHLTVREAKQMEVELIAEFGRWPYGNLTNRTDGGDSPLERHPLLGTTRSAETRLKISQALTGRKNGPHSAATRAKISAVLTGKKRGRQGPLSQEKRSVSLKKHHREHPEVWVNAGMIGKRHSAQTIVKMRNSAKARVDKARSSGVLTRG